MNQSILNFPLEAIRKGSSLSTLHYIFAYLILIFSTLLAYYPAFDNSFVFWDDQYYVTQNIYINYPTINHLKILLGKAVSLNYHPITMLSLWCNSYFFGIDSASSFVITNVTIHTAASIILFRVFLKISNSNLWLSLFVALIFAVHPMHVESVAWVSERKDVLYVFFFFLALYQYLKYKDEGNQRNYFFSLFFFIFSCLSKGMAVSLVPILFFIDFLKGGNNSWKKLLFIKIPFILIGLIIGLIALSIQSGETFFGLISNSSQANALSDPNDFTLIDRLGYTGYSMTYYLMSFFNWSNISAFHPYPIKVNWFYSLVPFLYISGMYFTFHKNKKLFFGMGFFLATLILILPYMQIGSAVMADRYTYLPFVGLSYIVALTLSTYIRQNIYLLNSLFFTVIVLCILSTRSNVNLWQNHITLFENVVEKYPKDARARTILASGYWKQGMVKKAIVEQEYAINTLGLYTSEGFENLGTFYSDNNEKEKALAFYNHSISLDTNNLVARYHRGLLLMNSQPQKAILDFNKCEEVNDEFITPLIYSPRGNCYGRLQQYDQAIRDFTTAIKLNQDLIISYEDRAMTYQAIGEIELANQDLEMATKLKNQ